MTSKATLPELSQEKKFEVSNEAQQRILELEQELQDTREHLQVLIKTHKALNQENNRAKDAFITHLSHELRTPLTCILGFSNLLQKDSLLNSQQLHYVDIVHDSGRHLLNLINDLLFIIK